MTWQEEPPVISRMLSSVIHFPMLYVQPRHIRVELFPLSNEPSHKDRSQGSSEEANGMKEGRM